MRQQYAPPAQQFAREAPAQQQYPREPPQQQQQQQQQYSPGLYLNTQPGAPHKAGPPPYPQAVKRESSGYVPKMTGI
jgi:hypothetical protein